MGRRGIRPTVSASLAAVKGRNGDGLHPRAQAGAGTAGAVVDLAAANQAARAWCIEVHAERHSEIAAVQVDRLAAERELLGSLPSLRLRLGTVTTRKLDRLSCVRSGSARYSVPPA